MKAFNKTFLPLQIKYNGQIYTYNKDGAKKILVKVLSRNLRGRTDLWGNPYKPTEHVYTSTN